MVKTIIKILGNGFLYGIYTLIICFCLGYFVANMPLKNIFEISVPLALCSTILNGSIYTRFTKSKKKLERIVINTQTSEIFIIEAPANHLIAGDIVSGKLCLTNKRLLFKSFEEEEFVWEKSELHTMTFYPSFKNKGGEFTVKDKREIKLMFEVDEIKNWKNELLKTKN